VIKSAEESLSVAGAQLAMVKGGSGSRCSFFMMSLGIQGGRRG